MIGLAFSYNRDLIKQVKTIEGSRWSAPSPEAVEGLDTILSNLPHLADVEVPAVPESTTPRPDPRAEQEMLKRLDGRFNAPSEQGDR